MSRAAEHPPGQLRHVNQGEFAVSQDPDSVLTAVLGSCVAVCLRDPLAGIGGMNHFLLPDTAANGSDSRIYGAQSMELLINGLLRRGARKSRLEAKVFGGARMLAGLADIGGSNGAFARRFLSDEGIACLAESLGGTQARRIRFWPVSGRARQILLAATNASVPPVVAPQPVCNDVELF